MKTLGTTFISKSDEPLTQMVLQFEDYKLALEKVKTMYRRNQFHYMAASLFVNIRDKNDKGLPVQVTCELRDMKELDDPLDRELQYWTSRMYTKFKTENHGLWATAISNIKEYEDNL